MADPTPLRLIARPITDLAGARDTADASTVEALLDGLPPGGRVLIDGDGGWLTEALTTLDAEVVVSDDDGPVDAVVFPLTRLSDSASASLRSARSRLDIGGRVVIEAVHPAGLRPYQDGPFDFGGVPGFARTLASWVRVLGAAGLVLRSVREPLDTQTGAPAGLILVAEPDGADDL